MWIDHENDEQTIVDNTGMYNPYDYYVRHLKETVPEHTMQDKQNNTSIKAEQPS